MTAIVQNIKKMVKLAEHLDPENTITFILRKIQNLKQYFTPVFA